MRARTRRPRTDGKLSSWAGCCLALTLAVVTGMSVLYPNAMATADTGIDSAMNGEIVITKFVQPATQGAKGTGEKIDAESLSDLTPIAGVSFEAHLVPGFDLTTDSGYAQALGLTPESAAVLVAGAEPTANGRTDSSGAATLGGDAGELPVGVYLVKEVAAPGGVIRSAPFLVMIPMLAPNGNDWMYTVYVYPKNSVAAVDIAVFDQNAVTCSDTVSWTTQNDIPDQEKLDSYVTENVLAPGLQLQALETIQVDLTREQAPELNRDIDYQITPSAEQNRDGFQVEFTEPGREKLVAAAALDADVQVTYETTTREPGAHTNTVRLHVDNADPIEAQTVTKFGPLRLFVHERGRPEHVIPGSQLSLHLEAESALNRVNAITPESVKSWETNSEGLIVVDCLRFSNFANGLDLQRTDPLFRYYYGAPVSYPAGWDGEWGPLAGIVNETLIYSAATLDFRVWNPGAPSSSTSQNEGQNRLAVTGVQIAGFGVAAATFVAIGLFLVTRNRRATSDSDAAQ